MSKCIIQSNGRTTRHVISNVAQIPLKTIFGLNSEHPPLSTLSLNFRNQIHGHQTSSELHGSVLHLLDRHPLVVVLRRIVHSARLLGAEPWVVGTLLSQLLEGGGERLDLLSRLVLGV